MNKKVILAGMMTGIVLSGCQSIENQLGNKLAESLINSSTGGEVKVNFDDLEKGKFTVETKEGVMRIDGDQSGGNIKVTDSSGKEILNASGNDQSFTVTGEDGEAATFKGGSGGNRPAEAPADMPSLASSEGYAYFTYGDMASLTFQVSGDLKTLCAEEVKLVEAAGWKTSSEGFSFEGADSIIKNYEKDGYSLSVMCGINENWVNIGLQKTKKV